MTVTSLTVEKITCLRGGRLVFRDLSFALGAGGALALEGPNGAGKTSLLRMLAGFLAPASGRIAVRDGSAEILEAEERGRLMGWLGHHDAAKAQMSASETLRFFARFFVSDASEARIVSTLERVGLDRVRDLPCQYLSAGQRKRLALARLAIAARPLWLLDEPLAALDTTGKALAAEMIAAHCASGGMAVVATHEPVAISCERLMLGMSA